MSVVMRQPKLELRCPFGTRRLFAKLVEMYGTPKITDGNLIEFSCPDCRRRLRTDNHILHRFRLDGKLVETVED
jgi:hypothetical protein